MKTVLILLSTYKGEKYLKQQIDSIISQKGVDVTFLVRDDGSNDKTLDILDQYEKEYPAKFFIEKGKNIGCGASFYWLIKEASIKYNNFDYFAFADQDDVWLEDKLFVGVEKLDKIDNKYKVYYCNYQMVDENLNYIPTPKYEALGSIEETFVFQPCIGCSMIMSKDVIEKAAIAEDMKFDIHDTWTYIINLVLGGVVIQDKDPHILYRQHSSNTVGSNQSFMKKWKRRIRSFNKQTKWRSKRAKTLLNLYGDMMSENSQSVLKLMSSYQDSIIKKWEIITSSKFKTNKKTHNLFFKLAILTNRI